jgi:hypothetical protein
VGALIRPVDQNSPGIEYQTIVTCTDLDLLFDENGISDWVDVQGLCFAPGLKPPPSGVKWVITGAFVQKVRLARGCNAKDLRDGQLECRLPWCSQGRVVEDVCNRPPSECMNRQFEETVQRWYHGKKTLSDVVGDGTCITIPRIGKNLKQLQVLQCLIKVAG